MPIKQTGLSEGLTRFAQDFAPKKKPAKSAAQRAAESATQLAIQNIKNDFKTMKVAALVLWECRDHVEAFLGCKRLAVATTMSQRVVKRILMSGAGVGGGMVGSIVPVVGTTVGGVVCANAVDTLVPGFDLVPNTELVERIEAASRGMFAKYSTSQYYRDEARDFVINDIGNRAINVVLDVAGAGASPVSVPVVWIKNNVKDLREVKTTTKLALVTKLKVKLLEVDIMIEKLHARFDTAFRNHRVHEQHYILGMPVGKGWGVKIAQHPDEWIRQSEYELYKGRVESELKRLNDIVFATELKYALT
ncbi:hypothetical protein ACIPZF_00470 [Pseudomonas sp. NPDC089752]|uniref:hypothetical protein n=1 Tax=Pseudomonas sp. NPDC089752 TaxID=3364472 RepID=UPI0037FF9299